MTAPDIGADDLRALIRSVLLDVLPAGAAAPAPATPAGAPADGAALRVSAPAQDPPSSVRATPERAPAAASTRAGADTVDLRSDADLDAFVRRLFQLFDNPKHRADILSGRRRFRLAGGPSTGAAEAVQRVDRGAVTEAHIKQAAAAGARLVLGVRAVMTPLARDRARALGVVVDKER